MRKVTWTCKHGEEYEDALSWKNDARGKQTQVSTWRGVLGERRPNEWEVCESWFPMDSVTILEGARAMITPLYEERALVCIWKVIRCIQKNDGTALIPRGTRKSSCINCPKEETGILVPRHRSHTVEHRITSQSRCCLHRRSILRHRGQILILSSH